MTTTLLLTTYNNPAFLSLVFQSLRLQTRMPDEVVIGDDGSTSDTAEAIKRLAKTVDIPVRHVWQPDKGFRKCKILNKALREATGDYIIQIDGDIAMHSSFIADHIRLARSGCFIRGSRVRLSEPFTQKLVKADHWPGNLPVYASGILNHREKALRLPFAIGRHLSAINDRRMWAQGCNFSYWRDDAFAINGYDEHFEGWGAEDHDFADRLLSLGRHGIKPNRLCLAYHLYHHERDLTNQPALYQYYLEQQKRGVVRCEHGIDNE